MIVSIVTISFNQAEYLKEAITSVSAQLGLGDEYIIVDPGSSDGSREIIKSAVSRDSRIKAVFEKDSGPGDGLNHGFSAATGDIFFYINADDFLIPGALEYAKRFFSRCPDVDVLVGSIKIADAAGKVRLRGRVPDFPSRGRLKCDAFQYYQQGTFFRERAFHKVKGFNAANRSCWDRELVIDMFIAGCRFATTSRPLGVFRLQPNSITGKGVSSNYLEDSKRIRCKLDQRLGRHSAILSKLFRIEARANPVRWLRQLVPI